MSFITRLLKIFHRRKLRLIGEVKYNANLLPHEKDIRDYPLSISVDEKLPSSHIIPINWAMPVKNQGQAGSCASHAFATALEIELKLNNSDWFIEGSEMWHYYTVRQKEFMNTFPRDSGQTLRSGVEVLHKKGMSPELLCPYDYRKINNNPGLIADSFARFWRIKRYEFPNTIQDLKKCLIKNKPIIFGVSIDRNFQQNRNGKITYPLGNIIGGHAMTIIGYDDRKGFRVVNSWGETWGEQGYCWIPYLYFESKNFMGALIIYVK